MGLTTVDDLLGLLQRLNVCHVLGGKLMVVTAGTAAAQVFADDEARARLVAMSLNGLSHQASSTAVGSAGTCTGHDRAQSVATERRGSLTCRSSLLADRGMSAANVASSTDGTLAGPTCAVRQVHGLLADAASAASEARESRHRRIDRFGSHRQLILRAENIILVSLFFDN